MAEPWLENVRNEIDLIDKNIVELLSRRLEFMRTVGKWKKRNDIPMMQPDRIKKQLERFARLADTHNMPRDFLVNLFKYIIDESCCLEDSVIKESDWKPGMLQYLLLRTRSYRRFDQTKPIELKTLKNLVDQARLTPSGRNLQPLKYYICNTSEMNEKIFPLLRWAGYLPDWDGPVEGEKPVAYIVVFHDNTITQSQETVTCDLGIVSQTIMMGAMEKNIGGCMIGSFDQKGLLTLLNPPSHLIPILVIALGTPAEEVVVEALTEDGNIKYYRDNNDVHHVPKRTLEEVIVSLLPEDEE